MNKNSIIAILAILVGLMAVAIILIQGKGPGPGPGPIPGPVSETNKVVEVTIVDGKTNIIEVVAPSVRSVERRPLEPEATKRLHDGPVIVSSLFEASGKAEHASYGKAIRGSYYYTTTVMAQSMIVDKSEDKDTGRVLVKEERKFLQSRDHLGLSDLDVVIALDTLPVDQVKQWVNGTCHIVSSVCTLLAPVIPPAAPWLLAGAGAVEAARFGIEKAFPMLQRIDGMSARGLLGAFGVKIPDNLEGFMNDRMAEFIKKGHVAIQQIEGKTFIITYEQEKNGAPLNVDYRNKDGSPITDAEWEILRSANAFLDANVVPDTRCRVGDTWTVWADEVQELFGCAGDGRAEGKIRVERAEDQKDGSWTLKVEPATVEFRSADGTAAGKMQIKDGNGLVDAENASVKSLHATASGNLRSLNKKRHLMFFDFVKRLDGDSNLRFTLTAEPATNQVSK